MNLTNITTTLTDANNLRGRINPDPKELMTMVVRLTAVGEHLLRQRTAAPPIIHPRDAAHRALSENVAREYERLTAPKILQFLLPATWFRAWVNHKTRRKHVRYVRGMMMEIRRWRA